MTGIPSHPPPKKRKHRPAEDPDTTHSTSKKRKAAQSVEEPPPEDVLSLQNRNPKSPKDKGKSRASDHPSGFRVVNASLVLSVPPVFASDLRAGVEEMLDSMVMRHIPSLQGVLLAHSNIRFISQTASIHGDCPFAVCNVSFDATVWGPQVSMKLVGRISLCSPDHISLLVHRTFNVSIPRHHIPQDQWTFEYGPAENDPESGEGRGWDTDGEAKGTADKERDVEMGDPTEPNASGESREAENSGRWVHHLTGLRLGDPDGFVEFTVIGLTVANRMLSLQGSIQPDPFSPEHVPHPDKAASSPFREDETPEVRAQDEGGREEQEEEEQSDEDGFTHLVRLTDEVRAIQKAKRAREEAERLEKAKKRKRRDSHEAVDGEGSRHDNGARKKQIKETTS